jgi:hypothetical protein
MATEQTGVEQTGVEQTGATPSLAIPGTMAAELDRALTILEPLLGRPESKAYVQDRVSDIALELFRTAASTVNVARLEAGVKGSVARDFDALRQVLDRLSRAGADAYEEHASGDLGHFAEAIERARKLITTTESLLPDIEPLEIGLRLELVVERAITDPLAVLRRPSNLVESLVRDVAAKLKLLPETDLQRLWAKITREIQLEPGTDPLSIRIPLNERVTTREFFDAAATRPLTELIARYLVDIRPRLVHEAFRSGQQGVPFPPVALAQVLSLTVNTVTLDSADRRLADHLMLLVFLLTHRLSVERSSIAAALRISDDARLLSGVSERQVDKLVPQSETAQIVFAECRFLISLLAATIRAAPEPAIELLVRHKLAAEVELPYSRPRFDGKGEIELQRALCAFLIGHGIFAVGTTLGPAETDLVTGSLRYPLVIEVKLFTRRPSELQIERDFGQLLRYMDQAPFKSRGALVLFNLSEVAVNAPKEFMVGRVAVIPINLTSSTPSARGVA